MKKVIAAALCFLWLAGCGADAGSQYLGKWQNVKFEKRTLQIDRNGETFIVRDTSPSMADGQPKTQSLAATVKDGILQVNGPMTISLVVDKANGHLTGPGLEYKKID